MIFSRNFNCRKPNMTIYKNNNRFKNILMISLPISFDELLKEYNYLEPKTSL